MLSWLKRRRRRRLLAQPIDPTWRGHLDQVRLSGELAPTHLAYWTRPAITTARLVRANPTSEEGLTEAEMEVQRKHLEAMGYVN